MNSITLAASKRKIILLTILCGFVLNGISQEFIIDCGNPTLQEYSKKHHNQIKNAKLNSQPIELPFFDDFSNSYIYPDTSKWINNFAFINNTYPINPITVGVATLDAIDQHGNVYQHLTSSTSRIADYLTSQPINLNYVPADSIYMSFYYQAGGIVDASRCPKVRDSLVLQFYNPNLDEWISVWHKEGGRCMEDFELILIPITDTSYLKSNFQFRFLNYASIGGGSEPSWQYNTSMWHIDYVKINKNRRYNENFANDIAFVYNIKSILNGYESVPWKHYYKNLSNLINDKVEFIYKNNWNTGYSVSRNFSMYDYYTGTLLYVKDNDWENINSGEIINYDKTIDNSLIDRTYRDYYYSVSNDSAKFILKAYLTKGENEEDLYKWNDTVIYRQTFDNYYAYDDGTAEAGYDVKGADACLAYKFTPLVGDTLKGVYIYFNKTLTEANKKYFYLTVWKDNNGYPGTVLQQIEGVLPEFGELNQFIYYPLDKGLYIDATFYIGWKKTTSDESLNVGLDYNNKSENKIFINTTGTWSKSIYNYTLLIRPVFEREPAAPISISTEKFEDNIVVYPNPTTGELNIRYEALGTGCGIEIYDVMGRMVYTSTRPLVHSSTITIDISHLQSGMYYLKTGNRIEKIIKF